MKDIKEIKSKIDPVILHTMPFLPAHNRKKDYLIKRRWGTQVLTLRAYETLNGYDLITLLQMLKDYIQNRSKWEKVGETLEPGKFILKREIDISSIAKERNIKNNDASNRKSIINSIKRWASVDCQLVDEKNNSEINTKYIYESKIINTKNYKTMEILINQRFFDFCVNEGLVIILNEIIKYKHETTILLDVFIQSTKWQRYDEKLLFEKIGLNETNLKEREKRRILKRTFTEFNENNKSITYAHDTKNKNWEKSIATHKKSIATHKRSIATHKPARNPYRRKGLISI